MSTAELYTIGWICALPTEQVAACEFLDEEHEQLLEVPPHDNNDYSLGRMGRHNIVIAVLPGGEYGTSTASSVARDMIRTFPNLRFGLMVGIGGGAPSPEHDIRLGDVVVSEPGRPSGSAPEGGHSGVMQYNYGETMQAREFQQTRVLDQPPTILRTAINGLKTQHERKGHKIKANVDAILNRNQRLRKNYSQPSNESDQLYKNNVLHTQHDIRDCTEACGRGDDKVGQRKERTIEDDNPTIHYGLVASGDCLMKDAELRDLLAQRHGVLCFEMEAAGLMNHFRCLVIRGVCDYSDTHKNKKWQGYAAMTAAAYTKELLCRITPETVHGTDRLIKQMEALGTNVENITTAVQDVACSQRQQIEHYESDQHRSCHRAFKRSNYEGFKNRNPERIKGTCSWVLQHQRYHTWRQSSHSDILWISADPGCGKSVLAKAFVDDDDFAMKTQASVCYFFFKDNEEQDGLATALCALLHQLFSEQPLLLSHAIDDWERDGDRLCLEVDKLWRILFNAAEDPSAGEVVCVLDALDECVERDRRQLIDLLCRAYGSAFKGSSNKSTLKFVITSRPYADLERKLDNIPEIRLRGEDENLTLMREIDLVIRQRVQELAKEISLEESVQLQLEGKLLSMEHRTYLWLYLAFDDIRSSYESCLRLDEASINALPSSVQDAYEKILTKIPTNQVERARQVLKIVVGVHRPFSIDELAYALGIATAEKTDDLERAQVRSDLRNWIRRCCGLFVFFSDSKVYLIHQTAKEFLLNKYGVTRGAWNGSFNDADVNYEVGRICILSLCSKDFEKYAPPHYDAIRDEESLKDAKHSFLTYCVAYWTSHLRSAYEQLLCSMQFQIDYLHDVDKPSFHAWFPVVWRSHSRYDRLPEMTIIRLCAFTGHIDLLQRTLDSERHDLDDSGRDGGSALYWSSSLANKEITQMLLEKGADVNAPGGRRGSALEAASEAGHDSIVKILLDNGADVNAQSKSTYSTVLSTASAEGHERVVEMLLDQGADINAQGGYYGGALQAASMEGHDKIVKMLLDKGADVNAQGGGALQAASRKGYNTIVEMLLDKGADVNVESGTALEEASSRGHDKIAEMLLNKGADVNAQAGRVLKAASIAGQDKVVEALLKRGADVNANGGIYSIWINPPAARDRYEKIKEMLQDRGAVVTLYIYGVVI